jgi:single-strand DNA-binding protein
MFNRVILIGRLTRDPELRYTQSGIAVTSFTLAVDRNYKNAQGEKETDFIPCIAWRQLAELCANYLAKGKLAAVEGRIQIDTGEKDGQRQYYTKVVAEKVKFLSPKDAGSPAEPPMHEVPLDDDIPW